MKASSPRATMDPMLAALKENGYRPLDLSRGRKAPFHLSEGADVRLSLLFLGAKALCKLPRMEAITGAIWAMSTGEAYHWLSKCSDQSTGRRAQRALRILLADR